MKFLTSALATCVLAWSCSGKSTPTAVAPPSEPLDHVAEPTPATPKATRFDPDSARSYFRSESALKGVQFFSQGRWAEAREAFDRALGLQTETVQRARLQLLMALCDGELGNHLQAANALVAAAETFPNIGDWIRMKAARHFFDGKSQDRALATARAVASSSIAGADAEMLIGDVLRAQGDRRLAVDHYRQFLKNRPSAARKAEAQFHLAEAVEHLGAAEEALALYRAVLVSAPLQRWAQQASDRIDAMLSSLSVSERNSRSQLSAAEYLERGAVYFDNMRNEESEADFEAAMAASGLDDDMRCRASYNWAQSVFKQRNRSRSAPLFDEAIGHCHRANNNNLLVKSAYQAGRSYAMLGKRVQAISRYERAEREAKGEHSYGDDARLRQAEEHHDLGHSARVTELLSSLPEIYPKGDMRAEALWRLAWRDYKDGDYAGAIEWLEKQIATVPIDDNYWAEGQAQYWLGRTHGRLNRAEESAAAYVSAIELYPLSYYSLLALNRLREKHPDVFERVRGQIAKPPTATQAQASDFSFKARPVYQSPGFHRALEFLRLGLGEQAEAELRRLGFAAPEGKKRVDDADAIDKLWAMAYLYDQAGRHMESHWVTRWHVLDFKRHWPEGPRRRRWTIAYPRAWWSLVEKHADLHGYPTELLMAFVREESAFDPVRESFANAIGLTQMIFPTARRFAKGTGIEVSRQALRDPEKNVTIGSRFLAYLVNRFDSHLALVVPSYNAGEGSTDRWLRIRGNWAVDEFAEQIPYDETRNYSKRVLASFFVYSYLSNRTIPVMPNQIPKRFVRGK